MSTKTQLRALKKIRPVLLSDTHALPSLIHNSLQASQHDSTRTAAAFAALTRSVRRQLDAGVPRSAKPAERQRAHLALAAKLPTPELRRPVMLDALDDVLKGTSSHEEGAGLGIGKRDRIVVAGRGMHVPSEMIAQKVREKFWFRI